MVVIGGYNSSNTISLAALCAEQVPTYHIEQAEGLDPDAGTVRYRVAGKAHAERTDAAWLPEGRPVRIGVTAGASTPNNKIGETVARILATRGLSLAV
jgi:4-hydroxy-3-methylbut-2-enyl diphosphate reductase